jgi:hypothetical protein
MAMRPLSKFEVHARHGCPPCGSDGGDGRWFQGRLDSQDGGFGLGRPTGYPALGPPARPNSRSSTVLRLFTVYQNKYPTLLIRRVINKDEYRVCLGCVGDMERER